MSTTESDKFFQYKSHCNNSGKLYEEALTGEEKRTSEYSRQESLSFRERTKKDGI